MTQVAIKVEGMTLVAITVEGMTLAAVKVEGTRGESAEIVFYDRYREGREEIAAKLAAEGGATVVPSFDDVHVVAGQGTVGLEILEQMPECDAVFFGTDILAVGAIITARRRGIAIPQQLAIAGYGDLDFAAHVEPAITSIHVADYDLGRLAGEMLLKRLNGEAVEAPVIQVPAEIKIRTSTVRN